MAFQTFNMHLEDIQPLEAQVAGHTFGIFKGKGGYVLKPLKSPTSKTELEFYCNLPSSSFAGLQRFVPRYFGTMEINISDFRGEVLVLEDLTHSLEKPCVMDVKIGRQTWDPFATPEKIDAEERKYADSKRNFSFCIPGFQVYVLDRSVPLKFGKEYGKAANRDAVYKAFSTFLNLENHMHAAQKLVKYYTLELGKIFDFMSQQADLHLYSSSILFTYDFAKLLSPEPTQSWAAVRMIDFAHAFSSPAHAKGRDENYIEGIGSLIAVLQRLLHQDDG